MTIDIILLYYKLLNTGTRLPVTCVCVSLADIVIRTAINKLYLPGKGNWDYLVRLEMLVCW